jgi:hypothetical protein
LEEPAQHALRFLLPITTNDGRKNNYFFVFPSPVRLLLDLMVFWCYLFFAIFVAELNADFITAWNQNTAILKLSENVRRWVSEANISAESVIG